MPDHLARKKCLYLEKRMHRLEHALNEMLQTLHMTLTQDTMTFDCPTCGCYGVHEDYKCPNTNCPHGLFDENYEQISNK